MDRIRSQLQRRLESDPIEATRVAVVLNGNARCVNESVIRELGQVVEGEAIFVSRSMEQSKFIARTIVNRGYDVVFCGGGDGTFAQCVTDILALRPARPPVFGVLRLGTGNALATTLGASAVCQAGLAADLHLARNPGACVELPLLRVEGRLAPFAGLGLDALILEDYNGVKSAFHGTPLHALGEGSAGYTLAIASRSLWRFVLGAPPVITVVNEGAPAQRVDLRGRAVGRPVARGEVIYQGPVAIAAASTIPYYGLGLRLFPQARLRTDRFQLRVGQVGALSVLTHLPALFRGEYCGDGIHDYFCSAISIRTEEPQPFQVGGDEVGRRETVHIGLASVQALSREPLSREPAVQRVPQRSPLPFAV